MDALASPALMVYTSDHGENFAEHGDENYYHSWQDWITGEEIYIPLMIYANDAFVRMYPAKMKRLAALTAAPISHDNLSQTFLGLAGLRDRQTYRPVYDLSSPSFAPQRRYVLRDFEQPVPLEEVHQETNRYGVRVGEKPAILRRIMA